MNLVLVRDFTNTYCTLGTLKVNSALTLQTLELPWLPQPGAVCGRPDRSCVPAGTYDLVQHSTPTHPKTFALVNPLLGIYHEPADVPDDITFCRVACLIHVANYVNQLEGCIGIGESRAQGVLQWMVLCSQAAFNEFLAAVPYGAGHTLTIFYPPGVIP